jgi:Flp pilus assembly protein TadB
VLSEREARVLRIIERRLSADDPAFAAMMVRFSPRRSSRRLGPLHALLITTAVLLAAVCIVLVESSSGLVALVVVWVVLGLRRWRPQRRRRGRK